MDAKLYENARNAEKRFKKIVAKIDKLYGTTDRDFDFEFINDDQVIHKKLSVIKDKVLDYFEGCSFKDDLLVELIPTNDDFSLSNVRFKLDFSSNKYVFYDHVNKADTFQIDAQNRGLRYLQIKVRKEELFDVICNGKPWEDLSIGFQCRIFRVPNIYNSEFWFYFTNIYVGKNVVTSTPLTL
ncbi:hypothetical protein OAR80_04300 [Methylophilaceae bacterium]|nr:hypothetical protein [Methylophilaceae bacterium]